MAKVNTSADPSMEEILASIRKIISDESELMADPLNGKQPANPKPLKEKLPSSHVSEDDLDRLFGSGNQDIEEEGGVEDGADVLDLPPEARIDAEGGGEGELDFVDPATAPFPLKEEASQEEEVLSSTFSSPFPSAAPLSSPQQKAERSGEGGEAILSHATRESVHAAFGQLNRTILTANARTLEDLVQDMLRPMLKEWLDANLPQIVERLVRAEIERVARGR